MSLTAATVLWSIPAVWWVLRPYPVGDHWARLFGAVMLGLTGGIFLAAWVTP